MTKATKLITMTAALFLGACIQSNEDSSRGSGESVLPEASNLFFSLPSSVASNSPSESVENEMVPTALSKKVAETGLEEESLFDAYKPVPVFIHLAEEAKKNVQAFVEELSQHDIPEKLDVVGEDGNRIVSNTIDTTILGAEQRFFRIKIFNPEEKLLLHMNYWKNARNQYRGNFFFFDRDPQSDFMGGAVHVHYNGHNAGALGQRMLVTAYRPEELLENANDPSVVRVWARKKGDRVFVTGGSYHPTFEDEFWPEGPKVYAFRAVANTEKDHAVLKVAFADAKEDLTNVFKDYAIDDMIWERLTVGFNQELPEDLEAQELISWTLENEKTLVDYFSQKALGTLVPPTELKTQVTVEEFKTYLTINKEVIKADAIQNGNSEDLKNILFLEMGQPVFVQKNGVFIGGISHEIPETFGVEKSELDSEELEATSVQTLGDFDPESEEDALVEYGEE